MIAPRNTIKKTHSATALASLLIVGVATPMEMALAYVGPGAGITMLGSLWGLIVAIVFVIGGLLILPIKLLRNKNKRRREEEAAAKESNGDQAMQQAGEEPEAPE